MVSSQKKRVLENIIFIPMCIDQQSLLYILTSLTNSQLKPLYYLHIQVLSYANTNWVYQIYCRHFFFLDTKMYENVCCLKKALKSNDSRARESNL